MENLAERVRLELTIPGGKLVFGTSALTILGHRSALADGRGIEPRQAFQPDLRLASECLAARPSIREQLSDDELLDIAYLARLRIKHTILKPKS